MESMYGNNRLIRKTMVKMFPSCFAANLTTSIALMVDTLLAGAMIGQQAIAAVAIGLPVIGIFQSIIQMVFNGSGVKMAVYAGRGDRKNMNRMYSTGLAAIVAMGLLFVSACFAAAPLLVKLFGGASNASVANMAMLYLRAASVCVLMGSLNTYFARVLALYGCQKTVFRSAMIAGGGNVVFSIMLMSLLPAEYALVGLGAGTWCGGMMACLSSYISIRLNKIPLRFKKSDVDLRELPEIIRRGAPSSGNSLADGVASGVVNNIIVLGFGGDTTALSVYTAVKGVFSFAANAIQATVTAASPLTGILYGSRDKNGIIRTMRESIVIGLVSSVPWCVIILLISPLLARLYGMTGNQSFYGGVVFCMLFIPLILIMRIFIQMFESTEKTSLGMLYSIVPDSVIYPIILALLLPPLGYNGIWLAYSANAVPFLLAVYIANCVKYKSFKITSERMLYLDRSVSEHVPMLDISIKSSNTDVTGISEKVHGFLKDQKVSARTSYMTALCLEELAADFVAHMSESKGGAEQTVMDIKLFSDEDRLRVIIRNMAAAYNPLDFELDDSFSKVGVKLAQKVAKKIEYIYVYKMNIITIDMDKN